MEEQEKANYFKYPTMRSYINYLSQFIKKDYTAMMTTFLVCLSAYTDDPLNLFLKGPSSTGKTYVAHNVAKVFPQEDVWILAGISPKALIHLKGHWEDEEGNEIDVHHPPNKEDVEEYAEWRENVDNARYVINLQGKILIFLDTPQYEVYNVLRPLLSHDKFESEYKIVEKDKRGPYKTQTIVLRGWPATIFCTAEEKYVEELATRSLTVTPSTANDKIKQAIELAAKQASDVHFEARSSKTLEELRFYLSYVADFSRSLSVVVPFAEEAVRIFPGVRPREMRDVRHFMSMIKAATLFNFVRRPYIEIGDKKYLISTLDDLKLVLNVFQAARETTEFGLSDKVLVFYHEVVEKLKQFDSSEAMFEWNRIHSLDKKSSKTIRLWLNELEAADLVSSSQDPADRRRTLYQCVSRNSSEIMERSGNRRISGLFQPDSYENWLRKYRNQNSLSHIHRSPVDQTPVDKEKLYRIITGRSYVKYGFGSYIF